MQSSSTSTGVRRLGVLVGPALIGALMLSSCGSGESGATASTIDLSAASTAFVVRPPATTVPPVDSAAVDPAAVVEGTQEYTVQSGDAPYVLVERFGITLEDLLAVNEWSDPSQFPFPGTVILIPPGATSVTAAADSAADTSTDDAATTDSAAATPTETIPDAGDNCAPGTYTIVEGDYIGKVASKFDVTVDALNAANVNTSGYSSFYVGLEIVIPAKSDC
ncbi:MAG TPA: LysM peptidoglycan-binding domain-containing protein [Ilumatobacteraceae bacterium]|nr:LysM peptidoglycan-binding domain-containing protein [Ilumatobacteraceae bacterium]